MTQLSLDASKPQRKSRLPFPLLMLIPPPIFFLLIFYLSQKLNAYVPIEIFPSGVPVFARRIGPGFLIAGGIVLIALSALSFLANKTTIVPQGAPSKLIINGAYSISRNPMYLGLVLLYLGGALWMGSMWPVIALLVPLAVMNSVVIPFEERRLLSIFEGDYAQYCYLVRRWI